MRNRHPYENRYCGSCQCTTRHEVKANVFGCLRCGVIKYPTRVTKAQPVVTALPISA